MTEALTESERLTFGALLRALVRLESWSNPEEQTAVWRAARELVAVDPGGDVGDAVTALLERSAERYPDDESMRAAAVQVTRQEAREAIFGALYEVSTAGTITAVESQLLDWLAEQWGILVTPVDAPTG